VLEGSGAAPDNPGMRPLRRFPLLLLAMALAAPAVARAASDIEPSTPEEISAVIEKAGHACVLTAPPGWVLDNEAGRKDGLDAVLYPEGSSWAGARVVMYALVVPAQNRPSLERFIGANLAEARHRSPGLSVVRPADLALSDGRRAQVRSLAGDAHGNHEMIAFIGEPDAVVMLVLTTRDPAQFSRAREAFASLVASYQQVAVVTPAP
jgi:hypothetical protein